MCKTQKTLIQYLPSQLMSNEALIRGLEGGRPRDGLGACRPARLQARASYGGTDCPPSSVAVT
jgi:hypothetical protein